MRALFFVLTRFYSPEVLQAGHLLAYYSQYLAAKRKLVAVLAYSFIQITCGSNFIIHFPELFDIVDFAGSIPHYPFILAYSPLIK